MNKKPLYLFALFFVFVQSLVSFGDYTPGQLEPNWPVTLGPEDECEEVVAYLKDNVDSIAYNLSDYDFNLNLLKGSFDNVYMILRQTSEYQNDPIYQGMVSNYLQTYYRDNASLSNQLSIANNISTNLLDRLDQINCRDCVIGDEPGGPTNSNPCCDFTDLYARLDQLISIQNAIKTQVQRLSQIQTILTAIKQQLFVDDWNVLEYLDYFGITEEGYPLQMFSYLPYDATLGNYLMATSLTLSEAIPSLNNYHHGFNQILWPSFTNEFNYVSSFFRQSKVQSPLLNFGNQSQYTDYYTYLTNYYFGMIRGDDDIPINQRTNWFTRIETLLAALVFSDGSRTNYYESAEESVTNAINEVADEFRDIIDEVSDIPTSQIELVEDIEKSMYQSLRDFSYAFSEATIPKSVRVIRVERDTGSKSAVDVIDVSVDVDGRLSDFVEILRSATTLCWVFLGLWFMFKFAVWTVKKIYILIRYVIDFYNMVAGGK